MDEYHKHKKDTAAEATADSRMSGKSDRGRKVLDLINELDVIQRDIPANLTLATEQPDISLPEQDDYDPYNSGAYRKIKT